MRRWLFAMALAALSASCSLLVSVDGLSGGPSGPSGSEGGAESAAPDGQTQTPEGSTSDGAVTRFCDLQKDARLCEDFDFAALPGEFTAQEAKGSVVSLVGDPTVSAPHALQIELGAESSATGERFGNVNAVAMPGPTAITINLSLRIARIPSMGARASAFAFEVAGADEKPIYDVEMRVETSPSGPRISAVEYFYGPDTFGKVTTPLDAPMNTWLTLKMTVDLAQQQAQLFRDGSLIGTLTLSVPPTLPTPPPNATLYIGAYAFGKHDGWTFQFDDVAVHTP